MWIENIHHFLIVVNVLPFQEGLRIRMKTIHNINMSPLGEKVISLMRPLMKKEMVNQVSAIYSPIGF